MNRASIPIESLADIQQSVIEVSLALSGKFDSQISSFKAERAALEKAHGGAAALKEAAAKRDEADKVLESARAEAASLKSAAAAAGQAAERRLSEAAAKEADLAQREQAVATRMTQVSELAAKVEKSHAANTAALTEVTKKAIEVTKAADAAKARDAALDQRERDLAAAKARFEKAFS